MAITMHSCRGNFRSTFIAQGGYQPIAERLLGELDIDSYFLEYDSDRAGSFEPLRFLPKGGKKVVLGLVTSKSGGLKQGRHQAKDRGGDQICRTRPAVPEPAIRLCLDEEGNILTEDEQSAKLRMIVELADEVGRSYIERCAA